jgi:hypothetical protein
LDELELEGGRVELGKLSVGVGRAGLECRHVFWKPSCSGRDDNEG